VLEVVAGKDGQMLGRQKEQRPFHLLCQDAQRMQGFQNSGTDATPCPLPPASEDFTKYNLGNANPTPTT
jgi:hypothetical protein